MIQPNRLTDTRLILEEFSSSTTQGTGSPSHRYYIESVSDEHDDQKCIKVVEVKESRNLFAGFHLYDTLSSLFLPVGYPSTVADGYAQYQLYDSVQGLCSYLRGVVSSAHILQAAGVGSSEATAWSAALTWAIKDGFGLLGGLMFSAWASSHFDAHVKEFRFFADLINNVGLALDMMAPLVPSEYFWLLASVSTLCKTLCGLSAGATKGSISQHFAVAGNLADVHAKEGSQETAVNLVGMIFGIGVARWFQQLDAAIDSISVWRIQIVFFSALTLVHVLANYFAVKGLRLRTLNRERTKEALKHVVSSCLQRKGQTGVISSPEATSESLLASAKHLLPFSNPSIVLGAAAKSTLQHCTPVGLSEFQNEKYLMSLSPSGQVLVSLNTNADVNTELKAYVHSMLVQESRSLQLYRSEAISKCHKLASAVCKGDNSVLHDLKNKGWDTDRLYLGYSRRRIKVCSDKRA